MTETEMMPPKAPQKGKVLVVEDERNAWGGTKRELEERGMAVDIAENAQEASRLLRERRYDAVVLDLNLPPGEETAPSVEREPIPAYYAGVTLFEQLRQGAFADQGTLSAVPVFVITGVHNHLAKERVDRLKPENYFAKPLAPLVVAEHVKLHLEDLTHAQQH